MLLSVAAGSSGASVITVAISTPLEFWNALVYVLFDFRKHAPDGERARELDGLSSLLWLDDWKSDALRAFVREQRARAGPRTTAMPTTWIARVGWKRHRLIDARESPRSPG